MFPGSAEKQEYPRPTTSGQKGMLPTDTQRLAEMKRVKPAMPDSTRSDVVDKILEFIEHYPTSGFVRIANQLRGIICFTIVYNILKRHRLNRRIDRLLALENIPSEVKIGSLIQRGLDGAHPLPGIKFTIQAICYQ